MIKKAESVLPVFLPLLIIITYLFLTLDTFIYPGAVAKYLFIDSRFYFGLSLALLLFFATKKSKLLNFILKTNAIILIPFGTIYLIFVGIEAAHYTNFVLATYNIHLDGLISIPLFSLSLFLVEKIKGKLPKPKNIFFFALIIVIAYFSVKNLAFSANTALNADFYVFLHPASSYDEKMYYQWGDFYRYMVFIKNNTSENAKIVIPPGQEPWLARTGDMQLVRAFLYPRQLIQYKEINIPDLNSLGSGIYIMVSWGDRDCSAQDCHGWPKQTIVAKKIIYKDPNSSGGIETKENFVYKKDDYKYVYGLISL